MHQRWAFFAASAAVAVAGIIGCGGDDDDSADESTVDADVTVLAKDSLEFDKDEYTVPAGEVTIAMENDGNMEHTLLLDGVDDFDKLSVVGSGDTDSGTVTLEPGEYEIYCDVPGHSNMKATLIVE